MDSAKKVLSSIIAFSLLAVASGCMNVRGSETLSGAAQKEQFSGKTIAVLPVKEQTALTTDSLLSLRGALNDKLDTKIKELIPGAKVIDAKTSVNVLNEKGNLEMLDELAKVYEGTGFFDKKSIQSLCRVLKADYIVFSRLKAEKMNIVLSKGFGASLEVLFVEKTKQEIVWGGSGEFKRGGIYGLGTTQNTEAADELIRLVFLKF